MQVALINLDSATQRRRHMTTQLNALGIAFERFGFDGRTQAKSAIAEWIREQFTNLEFDCTLLSGAEIGCWVSHLLAWRWMRDHTARPGFVVIEDDVMLRPDFDATLLALADPAPFDVIFLGTSSRNISHRRRERVGGQWVHTPVGAIFNTWGYVVSRSYVQEFLGAARHRIRMPIDHALGGSSGDLRPRRIGVLMPAALREDGHFGQQSQIEPHTFRPDRWRVVDAMRRWILSSRISSLYYSVYRLL